MPNYNQNPSHRPSLLHDRRHHHCHLHPFVPTDHQPLVSAGQHCPAAGSLPPIFVVNLCAQPLLCHVLAGYLPTVLAIVHWLDRLLMRPVIEQCLFQLGQCPHRIGQYHRLIAKYQHSIGLNPLPLGQKSCLNQKPLLGQNSHIDAIQQTYFAPPNPQQKSVGHSV